MKMPRQSRRRSAWQTYSDAYRSVVQDKGALVFHMLHSELGDATFRALLARFYTANAGKEVTMTNSKKLPKRNSPAAPAAAGQPKLNLVAFFSQWLNSTGIPEFKLEFIVYRIKADSRWSAK